MRHQVFVETHSLTQHNGIRSTADTLKVLLKTPKMEDLALPPNKATVKAPPPPSPPQPSPQTPPLLPEPTETLQWRPENPPPHPPPAGEVNQFRMLFIVGFHRKIYSTVRWIRFHHADVWSLVHQTYIWCRYRRIRRFMEDRNVWLSSWFLSAQEQTLLFVTPCGWGSIKASQMLNITLFHASLQTMYAMKTSIEARIVWSNTDLWLSVRFVRTALITKIRSLPEM